jgi:hypothetical protein
MPKKLCSTNVSKGSVIQRVILALFIMPFPCCDQDLRLCLSSSSSGDLALRLAAFLSLAAAERCRLSDPGLVSVVGCRDVQHVAGLLSSASACVVRRRRSWVLLSSPLRVRRNGNRRILALLWCHLLVFPQRLQFFPAGASRWYRSLLRLFHQRLPFFPACCCVSADAALVSFWRCLAGQMLAVPALLFQAARLSAVKRLKSFRVVARCYRVSIG